MYHFRSLTNKSMESKYYNENINGLGLACDLFQMMLR